jgi:hypothetical protein
MGALEFPADGLGEDERLERDGCICAAASPDLLPGSSPSSLIDDHSITENAGSGKKIVRASVASDPAAGASKACARKGGIFWTAQ